MADSGIPEHAALPFLSAAEPCPSAGQVPTIQQIDTAGTLGLRWDVGLRDVRFVLRPERLSSWMERGPAGGACGAPDSSHQRRPVGQATSQADASWFDQPDQANPWRLSEAASPPARPSPPHAASTCRKQRPTSRPFWPGLRPVNTSCWPAMASPVPSWCRPGCGRCRTGIPLIACWRPRPKPTILCWPAPTRPSPSSGGLWFWGEPLPWQPAWPPGHPFGFAPAIAGGTALRAGGSAQ